MGAGAPTGGLGSDSPAPVPARALPAPGNPRSHPGGERNAEPSVCCGAGGLPSLSGSLGFPALHTLGAFLWMGFAGIPGRSARCPRSPTARGERLLPRRDPAALSLSPAGRNSRSCSLLPFPQGKTRQLEAWWCVSSVLSVGPADTSLVPCPSRAELKAGAGAAHTRRSKNPPKGPGISK